VIVADLLRQDSQWLEQMRAAHCSGLVEYRRPLEAWTVQATFGKTGFEGTAQVWDFLILSDALPGASRNPAT
jgi:hypothetical protein